MERLWLKAIRRMAEVIKMRNAMQSSPSEREVRVDYGFWLSSTSKHEKAR